MFFPSEAEIKGDKKTDFERVRRAKQFCASCPVIKECRETFMSEPAGVFGGMSAGERARARRESAA